MKRFIWILLLLIHSLQAGNLKENLTTLLERGYSVGYLKEYMQPMATSVGLMLGSAAYHSGGVKPFPSFDIGLKGAYVIIPEEARYFVSKELAGGEEQKVPTVFGNSYPANEAIAGIDKNAFRFPLLQLNLGMFNNVELMVRFSQYENKDLGRMTVWGGGVKYGLSDLLIMSIVPVQVSVQAMYHTFSLDDYISSGAFAMNLHASSDIPKTIFSVYSGVSYENSSMVIKTDLLPVAPEDSYGSVTINGNNKFKYSVGISAEYLIFNLHADYNFGYYHSIAGGLMIVF
ncbi:MAG TPA: hypothetical protein ENK44_15595 [Caldithrix abyssi]|uniref:Transporter n=1 Tax=Caldithrix abyssi TaxID=187145 RepID=A0A7V4U499_CALAY|nr:hypothetical protein [Caldithrix abyssi]